MLLFTVALYTPLPEGAPPLSIQIRVVLGIVIGSLGAILLWIYQQPPKAQKNKVGIIIAIRTENERTKGIISKDFVGLCKKELEASNDRFQIIELNDYHSSLAIDHDSADQLRARCNGNFLIYGDTVQRTERRKKVYALRLAGLVTHYVTDKDSQTQLSEEMTAILPLKKIIEEDNELSGFEITSLQLAEATKYIIATAALLSYDYHFAINLLEEIRSNKSNSNFKKLQGITHKRLGQAYKFASMVHFVRWENTRDTQELTTSVSWISKFDKLNPNSRDYLLVKAIEHFVIHRDIASAMKCINQCTSRFLTDSSWKYSAAFLEAYRNDLDEAKEYYDSALNTESGHAMPFQVEGFIAWILEIEPDKVQLNFCLGYINEKFKNDTQSARRYYERFLNSRPNQSTAKLSIIHAQNVIK